jgi:hypothetical protein
MAASLPADKLNQIKQQLDSYLRANNVYDQIRGVLASHLSTNSDGATIPLTGLQEQGIITDVLR